VLFASSLFTIAFVVIGVAPSLPVLLAGTMLYGIGEGLFIPTLQDRVSGAATAATRGAIIASWVGFARAGQTAGPIALSSFAARTSTSDAFLLGAVFAAGIFLAEALLRANREHA
jgi:hypothetical protein